VEPRAAAAGASHAAAPAAPERLAPDAAAASDSADAAPAADDAPLAAVLDRFRTAIAESDRALGLALEDATLVERSEQRLVLAASEPFAARRLERRLADLESAAARFFGRPLRILIRGGDAPAPPRPRTA